MRRVILVLVLMMASAGALSGLPACPTEDSTWCVWDASSRGNGYGRSFVNVGPLTLVWEGLTR